MPTPGPDVRFITRKWPPAVGGMETYSVRLTESLADKVHLEVIALPGRPDGSAPTMFALLGFFLNTVGRLVLSSPATVTHIGDMALWPLGVAARLRHPSCRLVISVHGRDLSLGLEQGWKARAYRTYLRLGSRLLRSARIVANSAYIAGLARGSGFQSVAIVPLGTDFGASDAALRRHLLYAGRITRSKGLRFLVEAVMPLLADDVRLRVAGPVWEESEKALLADSRVDYLGTLDERQLGEEFSLARAVLVPSRTSEGFGLIAIEAAACGAYVVASNHSGLAEVVSPSIGALADANDPQAWARSIEIALDWSDEAYRAHSSKARAAVNAHYRWANVADATLEVYRGE